ncbi:MAG: glycosyltransferase family 39 protein [Chloroflexi bacterium]|nr:glycosyltransferase family 39 protein [Chloroflexota bacterium]
MNISQRARMSPIIFLALAILALVVLITYAPALRLNFFGDDYSFLERAGRASLGDYVSSYFDPARQDGWYRPMQGMLFGIEWLAFGANPLGYHLVNVLAHVANCLLLFAIVARVTQRWRAAWLAALLYSGLPLYGVAVFWPGDADFLLTLFYLLTIYFWIYFLQSARARAYALTIIFFLLALATKEFGVTLPVVLFLIDRLALQPPPDSWREIVRYTRDRRAWTRYAPFVLVLAIYFPIEYVIQARSVLTNLYGYSATSPAFANFFNYLAALAFPWGLPEPLNYFWLISVSAGIVFFIFAKKHFALLTLMLASILTFLPVIFFPWFLTRYLYLAVMAFAILFAFGMEYIFTFVSRRAAKTFASLALALLIAGNAFGVADAAAGFGELARQSRVPFRDLSQRHPTFPADTYLYFIDPPVPTSELSGMFFLRYGAGMTVKSNLSGNPRADWRDHANAYVIYFDEQNRAREIAVAPNVNFTRAPRAPLDFRAPVRFEGFEIAQTQIKRGDPLIAIFYWRALSQIEKNYARTIQLVDAASGKIVAEFNSELRGATQTSAWKLNELIAEAIVFSLPTNLSAARYRLEIALYDRDTSQRVPLRDPALGDQIVIEPIEITDAK